MTPVKLLVQRILLGWVCFTCLISVAAQGTLEFRVNLDGAGMTPLTSSIAIGYGTFYLEPDNRFHGSLGVELPAFPAAVQLNSIGQNGGLSPVLLTLTPGLVTTPDGSVGFPGAQSFDGTINLTSEQRADLLAGRMYFTATTAAFPEGELRGQLLLVPEPSAMALIGIGCFALLLWKAHITHNRVGPRT